MNTTRRTFLSASVVMLAAPRAARAQSRGKLPLVAVLNPGPGAYVKDPLTCPHGFLQGLRDLGYVDGQNVRLEYRHARGDTTRMPALAAELVRLAPEVIWTHSLEAIIAAKQATRTIPIVFGVAVNSVEEGLVATLSRPGGNVTGMELRDMELTAKRLQVLREALPSVTRVAMLVNPAVKGLEQVPSSVEEQARALGIQLQWVKVRAPEMLEAVFAATSQAGVQAVVITEHSMFARARERLAALALKHRLPTMCGGRHFVEAGHLIGYGAFPRELCQRSAGLVDRILKGARPADLPVELADRFYLVVNLKTAKALGVTISPSLLSRADQVIE